MFVTRASILKSLESVVSQNNCARKNVDSIQTVFLNLSYSLEKLGSAEPIKWSGSLISGRALVESSIGILPVSKYYPRIY